MKSIVWLASYPKSGNTWLRIFLANYLIDGPKPVPINQVHKIGIGDSGTKMYQIVYKGQYNEKDPVLTAKLRPAVLQGIVNNKADINFVKTHCENGSAFSVKLVPANLTRSAIYIMRNPMDMIISYAAHFGISIDHTIYSIARNDNTLGGGGNTAHQFLGSWSNHVLGWSKEKKFPVLTLRYEDMLTDPKSAFSKAVRHIGLPEDEKRLDKAIKFSEFKSLQKQERTGGFVENSENQKSFFRSGQSGQWRDVLTKEQVSQMQKDHGQVMRKFQYNDEY